MAVRFCFARGWSPQVFSCGMEDLPYTPTFGKEEIPETTNITQVRLSDLGPLQYKTYTPEVMRARVEVAMSMPDERKDIWKNRIICILGPLESVFCINFIPSDPHQPQILQVMRMKDLNESAVSYRVYCCDFLSYKFIIPKEHPDQVFNLSQKDVSQLIPVVEPTDHTPVIAQALHYLKNEKTLKGMALTLQSAQGNFKTYVWIKA